ncbi:MAG: hypothetical protein ACK5ZC_03845 [Pirellulaceae bacterium]
MSDMIQVRVRDKQYHRVARSLLVDRFHRQQIASRPYICRF